ncbi:MAG: 2-C-methyl-D-erythritol 4-phosphate cytidylyltransferase [Firmicutes bacterium]|nr:2-C-methyl-D-erythritol 4-phosphate cytidylyltransferase [Bacillota bacterium]
MAGQLRVWAIVPAAGSGSRMGATVPKQYLQLRGVPIVARTISRLALSGVVDEIIISVPPGDENAFERDIVERYSLSSLCKCTVVAGGADRQESVWRALRVVLEHQDAESSHMVLVHDGVRPLVSKAEIVSVVEAAKVHGAAACAVPPKDTVKLVGDDGLVAMTPDRSRLCLVQTPQAFRLLTLRRAHERAEEEGYVGTDDCSLVERLGLPVALTPGSYENIKITTMDDLALAEILLAREDARDRSEVAMTARVGQGYDVHPLVCGRELILGGVRVPHEKGLSGHSDADVLTHAICDAILGAACLGDIGMHFPDTDPAYAGICSIELLRHVVVLTERSGYRVTGMDATVIAERPKISPFVPEMRRRLASAMNLRDECVNIKGKTTEGLGFTGSGEGIAALAVATLIPVPGGLSEEVVTCTLEGGLYHGD